MTSETRGILNEVLVSGEVAPITCTAFGQGVPEAPDLRRYRWIYGRISRLLFEKDCEMTTERKGFCGAENLMVDLV